MKRYLLFVFDANKAYSLGGLNDMQGSYDSLDECFKEAQLYDDFYYSFHVLDLKDRIIYNNKMEEVKQSELVKNMFGEKPSKINND